MEERKSRYELFLEEEARKAQPTKKCSKCKEVKSVDQFGKVRSRPDGFHWHCLQCRKVSRRKYKNREDRFWKYFHAHTRQVGDCLEWASIYTSPIRRRVYRLSIGDLPDDMLVTTSCRNKRCVLQSHLKRVTADELRVSVNNNKPAGNLHWNAIHPDRVVRGEKHGQAKRTEDGIRAIRKMYDDGMSICAIARSLSAAKSTISRIVKRKIWAHVQ